MGISIQVNDGELKIIREANRQLDLYLESRPASWSVLHLKKVKRFYILEENIKRADAEIHNFKSILWEVQTMPYFPSDYAMIAIQCSVLLVTRLSELDAGENTPGAILREVEVYISE